MSLDAYFQRIGYTSGPLAATLETLCALHLHHVQAIAFENLDPLSGRPVKLDLGSLEGKLLHAMRGGYCYEQNLLFSHVLQELGFRVTGLAARVIWNAPEGAIRPCTHMLLRVELSDGPYIADVGFGGQTLTAPIRLVTNITQPTPHEPFRLVDQEGDFVLQTQIRDRWKSLYRFNLQRHHQVDYEVANWYVSTHPQSLFVSNLIAARPFPGGRYALHNNTLTVHETNGESRQQTLATADDIRAVLESTFGLRLPIDPALDAAFTHWRVSSSG
jgi:N-hydroxyarylamine O-acetyltransferase